MDGQLHLPLHAANEDGWAAQWEAKHQAEISACALRIGSDPERLAAAMRHADRDQVETLCIDLLTADDAESVRMALSIFCNNYVRAN